MEGSKYISKIQLLHLKQVSSYKYSYVMSLHAGPANTMQCKKKNNISASNSLQLLANLVQKVFEQCG